MFTSINAVKKYLHQSHLKNYRKLNIHKKPARSLDVDISKYTIKDEK